MNPLTINLDSNNMYVPEHTQNIVAIKYHVFVVLTHSLSRLGFLANSFVYSLISFE